MTKKELQEKYPTGTTVMCILMSDDPYPVPSGTRGVVTGIDDMNQIHVNWENGSSLALIPGIDEFTIIK